MKNEISNRDDLIDSRQVIERIEELESELESLKDAFEEAQAEFTAAYVHRLEPSGG